MQGILVGYGNMGRIHEHAAEVCGANILSIVDPNPHLQIPPKVVPTIDSLKDERPDFAVIATPTHEHLTILEKLIERFAGNGLRGILLEKPPVRTRPELERLTAIAERFGHIFVGEVEQYNPALAQFADFAAPLQHVRIARMVDLEYFLHGTRPWFLDETKSGGIVLDLMIHDINLLVAKYGLPRAIIEVAGEKRRYDTYDTVRASLDYGEFTAELVSSWTAKNKKPITLHIDLTADDKNVTVTCDTYTDTQDDASDPYIIQMQHFLDSIDTGVLPVPLATYTAATDLALQIQSRLP